MKIISLVFLILVSTDLSMDFGSVKDNSWYSLNDSVMGGRSKGITTYNEDALVFEGSVSFENNGGFASVRSPYGHNDLTAYTKVQIRYKSSGQSIGFVLEHYREWFRPNFKAVLEETNGEWRNVELVLANFDEHRIGKPHRAKDFTRCTLRYYSFWIHFK